MDEDNDGRFPDDSLVEVRYPRNRQEELGDRSARPWLPGAILGQCGPDEWHVCVEARELATLDHGSPAPAATVDKDLLDYPCCRDASEIRRATDGEESGLGARSIEVYAGPVSGCLLIVSGMPAGDGPFDSLEPLGDLSQVRRQTALGSLFQD